MEVREAELIDPEQVLDECKFGLGVSELQVFDLAYFRNFPVSLPYRMHNTTLKFCRHICESTQPQSRVHWFCNNFPTMVAKILHDPHGTEWTWDTTIWTPWHWQEMVALLEDGAMSAVVCGPQNLSRGLVGCCIQESGNYDHKRHYAK